MRRARLFEQAGHLLKLIPSGLLAMSPPRFHLFNYFIPFPAGDLLSLGYFHLFHSLDSLACLPFRTHRQGLELFRLLPLIHIQPNEGLRDIPVRVLTNYLLAADQRHFAERDERIRSDLSLHLPGLDQLLHFLNLFQGQLLLGLKFGRELWRAVDGVSDAVGVQ